MKKTCELHSVLLLALLMFFLSRSPVAHVQCASFAQSTPIIYLQPTENLFYTNQTLVGDRFNVTVWVRDAPPIVAWQVHMEFSDSVINATRWVEPTTDPQYIFYGKETLPNPTPSTPGYGHLDIGRGSLQVESILFPTTQPSSSGSGKLCIFEFNITRYPTSDTISSLLNITSADTVLLNPDGSDVSPVTKQDGSFNYTFVAVPTLRLVEDPQFIQFTPYQNVTGSSFNTTVSVDGPASVAGLTNASFTLNYDPSLFSTSESNVILNSIWVGPHDILIGTGQVTVAVSNPSPLPSEPTVLICMIAFTVQQQQTVPPQTLGDHINTSINFTSSTLLNSAGNAINRISPSNQTITIYAYQIKAAVLAITQPAITSAGTTIQNGTQFAVNVSITAVYNPSLIQVRLLYNQSVIMCNGVSHIGEVALDKFNSHIHQPDAAVANVSINGHTNPIISGPIFQFEFIAVTENATSYLNFSQPYGQGTLIQDSSGAIANVTYSEIVIHVSETPRPHLVLESSQKGLNTTVRTQCSFELTVKNEGNIEATNVSLFSHGVPSSWLQFSEDEFPLAPNSEKNVNVTVTPMYAGEFNLTITATSLEGNTPTITLTLSVSAPPPTLPLEWVILAVVVIGTGIIIAFIAVRNRKRKEIKQDRV